MKVVFHFFDMPVLTNVGSHHGDVVFVVVVYDLFDMLVVVTEK